ncbi:MAG TPA: SulP family inorganic anion transporter [Verrucomicrobiales bacterium]|nr:SulP family inorganic anion transporter [Verrucomicrobiales bacterium]
MPPPGKPRFSWLSLLPGGHLRAFPLKRHLAGYDAKAFRHDAAAGFNVALPAIAQGMAFAMIAGLPHEVTGILCSAVAAILGAFFAASRYTILGPTNATSLMVFSSMSTIAVADRTMLLPVLVLFAGMLLVAGAGLRMADMIQYISRSVIVGYVTGAAILIVVGQIRDVVGITSGPRGSTLISMLANAASGLHLVPPGTASASAALASGTILGYVLMRRYAPKLPALAFTLAISSAVVALIPGNQGLFYLHSFTPADLLPQGVALTDDRTLDSLGHLVGPALAVAFLAALENTVMGKALSGKTGDSTNFNQDLLACGVANIGCAFAGGMPASASLTRSALNHASGARTPVSSLICGLLCLTAALLLGGVASYIPRPALAALVMCLAVHLIHPRHLRICWRATRSDAITLAVTITSTLLMPLHVAIFVGVATSVVLYLRKAARPSLVEYEFSADGALQEKNTATGRQNPGISIVHVEGELFFGAAELFRTQIQRTAHDENLRVIILRMKNARHLDATSVMAMEELIAYLRSSGRHLLVSGLSKEVYRVLRNSGMVEVIGRDNLFMGSAANPNLSTRNALKRAQELLGTKHADVHIFYDPSRKQEG